MKYELKHSKQIKKVKKNPNRWSNQKSSLLLFFVSNAWIIKYFTLTPVFFMKQSLLFCSLLFIIFVSGAVVSISMDFWFCLPLELSWEPSLHFDSPSELHIHDQDTVECPSPIPQAHTHGNRFWCIFVAYWMNQRVRISNHLSVYPVISGFIIINSIYAPARSNAFCFPSVSPHTKAVMSIYNANDLWTCKQILRNNTIFSWQWQTWYQHRTQHPNGGWFVLVMLFWNFTMLSIFSYLSWGKTWVHVGKMSGTLAGGSPHLCNWPFSGAAPVTKCNKRKHGKMRYRER